MIIAPKHELPMHVTTPEHSLKLLLHWHWTAILIHSSHWNTSGVHQTPHFSKCLRKENPRSRSRSSRDGLQAVTRGERVSRDSSVWREVQLSRRRPTVHFAKPLDLLVFECPNQNHSFQDAISLSPCQTKQPNISTSFLSASPSSCFAADQWTWAGWYLLSSGKVLVFRMLYHKQNLLFHCKRKFLRFNFLIKFIFNDQTLSNIMYTCTQQEFLLGKKKSLKRIMIKIVKTAAWIFIFLPKVLLKYEKKTSSFF